MTFVTKNPKLILKQKRFFFGGGGGGGRGERGRGG